MIETTSDGGATWVPETVPTDAPTLTSVSCGSATRCVAVGSESIPGEVATVAILSTQNGGRSWSETVPAGGSHSGLGVLRLRLTVCRRRQSGGRLVNQRSDPFHHRWRTKMEGRVNHGASGADGDRAPPPVTASA